MIYWPPLPKCKCGEYIVMPTEDGVLGCATLKESKLELWSMEAGTDGAVKWAIRRVVELENLLPSPPRYAISCANGVDVFFVRTDLGTFTVELNSGRVKKVSNSTNIIPYMSFYTPDQAGGIKPPSAIASSSESIEKARDEHHDLLRPHSSWNLGFEKEKWVEKSKEDCECEEDGWEEEAEEEDWEWNGDKAQELFDEGSKAIEEGQLVHAEDCFYTALRSRVLYYGRLSPMCVSTYYKYGYVLLYKARAEIAPYQDWRKSRTSRDDTGSSKASGSNAREDDTEKDLDLAWKMLHIAKAILEKSPCDPVVEVLTYCSLAEVSMEREDIHYSLSAWFKALAILEHLVEPDHCRIILINFHIFLAFKSASKIGDAIPYAAKVISFIKSRMQKLNKAYDAFLAVEGDNIPGAEVSSEKSSLDNDKEFLATLLNEVEEQVNKSVP
ncbi:hypothetical protein VPH35_038473 [Triticum aestivum]